MALKVKNPKKNLADILIEKERLNESYDSSSAVSLKTLEQSPEGEEAAEKAESIANKAVNDNDRPIESTEKSTLTSPSEAKTPAQEPIPASIPAPAQIPAQAPIPAPAPVNSHVQQQVQEPVGYYQQGISEGARRAMPVQERKPWEDMEEYNPPRKKRGRPYQGYAENTHVQSIYVRNDLYEYIMVNYVGHGRKHTSFNKFVNAAINNYLRQLDEGN